MPKSKKLTQRKLADNFVKQISEHFDDPEIDCEGSPLNGLYTLHRRLLETLDKAQNSPPEGESDGSINEANFNKLREVEMCVRYLKVAIDNWHMGQHK
jgi:hypothetical protein